MGKAQIKHDVFRAHLLGAIRAVKKSGTEASHNFVPQSEPNDPEQTLENVTCVIEDTGIRLHGYNNVNRVADTEQNPSGFLVNGVTGSALMHYILSPVKRAFAEHARVENYGLIMDKGIFMPRPKQHTQKHRTTTLLETMQRQQIAPLTMNADGSAPSMISRDGVLPPWIAVRANRRLYRHATDQLLKLILEEYKPPPGRRLIIDSLDMAAVEPETLDQWMVTDRLVLDEFAKTKIEMTREALRATEDWRPLATKVVTELAHAGHIWSVPICLETNAEGVTYAPFLLPNAKNQCGEADVGILFWLYAMQSDKQHNTLEADRRMSVPLDEALADYYDYDQRDGFDEAARTMGEQPESVEDRRKRARVALETNPDLLLTYREGASDRALVAIGAPQTKENPCRTANRMLVLSSDTDFLSLTTVFYAQVRYEHPDDPQYAIDNAPLVCVGECQVMQFGWLSDFATQFVPTSVADRKKRKWDEANKGALAHELYDMHRLYGLILKKVGKLDATPLAQLEAILSFAMFCAACENDFLAGLYFVNRECMWEAFCAINGELVMQHERHGAVLMPKSYAAFIKHCYYNSLMAARGTKNKPSKPAARTTYNEVAALVRAKSPSVPKKHMPDGDTLRLMFERSQWWIVYASKAWQSIDQLLDDTTWGWRLGTIDLWV